MDPSRDLSQSLPGPWIPADRLRKWTTYMFPVIQHRDRLALQNDTAAASSGESRATAHWEANQNSCLLPHQYGRFLNEKVMYCDTLYALGDIFRLSAASERQFLNLLRELLDREVELTRRAPLTNVSMLNLRYFRKVLEAHITRLTDTVLLLGSRDKLDWPRATPGSPEWEEAERFASMLLQDFSQLHRDAERLSVSFGDSIQSLANNAAFQESVKAVDNARRVERLTLLATVFLPLTLTCSIFGMNFSLFGQGDLSIWVYFPTAVVVVGASFLLWYYSAEENRKNLFG